MGNYIKSTSSSNYCTIDTPSDGIPVLSDYSICAWIKCSPTFFGGNVFQDLLIYYIWSDVLFQFRVRGDTGCLDAYLQKDLITTATVIGSTRVDTDTWKHVAFTCDRDSSTGMKIYINGVEETCTGTKDPTDYSAEEFSNVLDVYFCSNFDQLDKAVCLMDQLRFYKAVLTQNQIAEIYNNGKGVLVNETEFAAIGDGWYSEFDEITGTAGAGRKRASGEWADSDFTLSRVSVGPYTGGVPFIGGLGAAAKIYYGEE